MSFDKNILEELHKMDPKLDLIYLSEKKGIKTSLEQLSFKPNSVGLYYKMINKRSIKLLREQNIGVYAWTINNTNEAHEMMSFAIDGIITDYPRRIIEARGTYSSRPKRFGY